MSAGSAFAAGLRSGQAIYDSAVKNAMARKRLDMAKTEFEYSQAKRKQDLENQTKAQSGLDTFLYEVQGLTDMTDPSQFEAYNNALAKAASVVSLNDSVSDQFGRVVSVIEQKTGKEQALKLRGERGLLLTKYRSKFPGQDVPSTDGSKFDVSKYDFEAVAEKLKRKSEEEAKDAKKRGALDEIEVEFTKRFPGESFPVEPAKIADRGPMLDEIKPAEPTPDYSAASMAIREFDREQDIAKAATKSDVDDRVEFNRWKISVERPDAKITNIDDRRKFKTFRQDQQIKKLMSEAGFESFKLLDNLEPDLLVGGYKNIDQVAGQVADLVRKQEEDADVKKATAQKPLSESQATSYIFAGRMKYNQEQLDRLADQGFNPATVSESLLMATLPEVGKTTEQKLYIAAKANWVAANLRKESGAAIAESEYTNAYAQYFPKVGDSAEVIAYKRNLRQLAERDMRDAAMGTQAMGDSYRTLPAGRTYRSKQERDDAYNRGELKVGDSYKYLNEQGQVVPGVLEP